MSNPLLYESEHFVVLESGSPEQLLAADEMRAKLANAIANLPELPQELQKFATLPERVEYLLDTSCELNVGAGNYLQWYAVRLEK